MRADIVPVAKFPDYELLDQTKTPKRLSELQGKDPMILVLSREQPLEAPGVGRSRYLPRCAVVDVRRAP